MSTVSQFVRFVKEHPGAKFFACKELADAANSVGLPVQATDMAAEHRLYAVAPEGMWKRKMDLPWTNHRGDVYPLEDGEAVE